MSGLRQAHPSGSDRLTQTRRSGRCSDNLDTSKRQRTDISACTETLNVGVCSQRAL